MESYDVFISYRRDGAEFLAHNLYERLTAKGFSVFQDIESLRSGKFNTALYDVILSCKTVLLILPPHGLDRCVNEDDWVRNEVSFALKNEKLIVPIMMPGFEWPDYLPEDMDPVRNFNGLNASGEYFDGFINKLIDKFLLSPIRNDEFANSRHSFRTALIIIIYILGLLFPLIYYISPSMQFSLIPRIIYFIWILFGAIGIYNQIETRPQFAAKCFGTIKENELNLMPDQLYSRIAGVFGQKILISNTPPDGFVSFYNLKNLEFGSWDGQRTNYFNLLFRRTLEPYDPSVLYLHSLSRGGQAVKMLTRQGFVIQTVPDFADHSADYLVKNKLHVFLYYKKRKLDRVIIYNCDSNELKNHYIRSNIK